MTTAAPRTGEPPERFGRYRLLKKLGRGGTGVVHLAHDPDLNRLVALKTPLAPADPAAAERFRRAGRAAAALHHPNICPLYEAGALDGAPYLTMAYIDGVTLAERLRGGRLPADEAARLVRALALALAEAHDGGVFHGDVKPANILLNRRGEPILTDFGLADLGTPGYLPPERPPDGAAADVYALGVVFSELLTGRPPSHPIEGLDSRLEAVVLRATAAAPAERYPNMAAFADALRPFCGPEAGHREESWSLPVSTGMEGPPVRRGRPKGLTVAAAAGLILLVLAAWAAVALGWPRKAPSPPDAAEACLVRARAAFDGNDMDGAIHDATAALSHRPGWAQAFVLRGRAEYREGRDGQADADFVEARRLLDAKAGQPSATARDYADRAWCDLRIDRRDAALTDCAAALRLDADCTAAWLLSLRAWHEQGRRDKEQEAGDAARNAIKPASAEDHAELACLAVALDRPDDALRSAEEAARLDPQLPDAYEARARAWMRKGDHGRAAADFGRAAALMKPRWARDFLDRSILHELAGETDQALADAGLALDRAPRLPAALRQRGTARRAAGDRAAATADYREAGAALTPCYSEDYFDRGWLYDELGDCERAAVDLDRALALGLRSGELYRESAHACRALGRFDDAGARLAEAARLLPADDLLCRERGALAFARGRYEESVRAYTELLALAPDDAPAYAARGDAHFRSAQYEEAVADYGRALEHTPAADRAALADFYDRRGVALVRLGRFADAAADYTRAIENAPDDPVLYRNRAAARLQAGDDAAAEEDARKADAIQATQRP